MKNAYLRCVYGKGIFNNEYAITFKGLEEVALLVNEVLLRKINGKSGRIKVRVSDKKQGMREEKALIEFNGHCYEVPRRDLDLVA